jgi:hypothetical protein
MKDPRGTGWHMGGSRGTPGATRGTGGHTGDPRGTRGAGGHMGGSGETPGGMEDTRGTHPKPGGPEAGGKPRGDWSGPEGPNTSTWAYSTSAACYCNFTERTAETTSHYHYSIVLILVVLCARLGAFGTWF